MRPRLLPGIFVAVLVTLTSVVVMGFASPHANWLMMGMAIALYFIPGVLVYAICFLTVRLIERAFCVRGGFFQIILAAALPSIVPLLLIGSGAGSYQFALGMIPGGFLGALIAFWPAKQQELDERIEPTSL
jgi:hypothetical protein